MMYQNSFKVTGFLGSDPVITQSPYMNHKGEKALRKTARFTIATTKVYTDKKKVKHENTFWTTVFCHDYLASYAEARLKKGSGICVEGELSPNYWVDKNGVKQFGLQVNASFLIKEEPTMRDQSADANSETSSEEAFVSGEALDEGETYLQDADVI